MEQKGLSRRPVELSQPFLSFRFEFRILTLQLRRLCEQDADAFVVLGLLLLYQVNVDRGGHCWGNAVFRFRRRGFLWFSFRHVRSLRLRVFLKPADLVVKLSTPLRPFVLDDVGNAGTTDH